ncbi:MAG TPA: flagellar hook-associated protein FlgL [Acidobacteriota bacterium]|nr:flagellar hook-associated protein FlgL [Acidobacteriota bacterium]
MRVADRTNFSLLLENLARINQQIFKRTREISSGKKLHEPSQDPAPSARLVRLRDELSRINQFQRNIQKSRVRLGSADEVLNSLRNLIDVVHERGAFGLTETINPQQRETVADEIEQILNSILSLADSEVDGRKIFSGSQTDTEPYQLVGGSYVYQGDGERLEVEIADNRSVLTSIPGQEIFTDPSADLLNSIAGLVEAFRAGDRDAAKAFLEEIGAAEQLIDLARVRIGEAVRLTEETERAHQGSRLQLVQEASGIEDADIAEAITELTAAETSLQATLQTGARQRVSLFDLIG